MGKKESSLYGVNEEVKSGSVVDIELKDSQSNWFRRAFDSFKPPQNYDFATEGMTYGEVGLEYMARNKHDLRSRHLLIISLSACIGTGLFIGSGNILKQAGPSGLLLGSIITAMMVLCSMASVSEMSVRYPSESPFSDFPARFFDRSWGFTLGWMYALAMIVSIPLELIAGAMATQYWKTDDNAAAHTNPVAWVTLLVIFFIVVQLFGNVLFAEYEFFSGSVKILTMVGFILFAIIVDCGGGSSHEYIGGSRWEHPANDAGVSYKAGFANSFKGIVFSLANWPLTYGTTEISCVSAAESTNPVKSISSLTKRTVWRFCIFFILGISLACLIVPFDNADVGSGSDGSGSPFVIALRMAEVKGLPSVFNSVIIISVLAMGNSAGFAGSRIMVSLAANGHAPKFLGYVDRKGRPLGALSVEIIFAALSFVCASDKYSEVFNWMYAFISLVFLFVWAIFCLSFLNMRWAMKYRGVSTSELVYKSPLGIPGAVIGAILPIAVLGLQFWIYIWPFGYDTMTPRERAETFFQGDLSVIVALILFVGHKAITRSRMISYKEIDLDSNLREIDYELLEKEKERKRDMTKNPALFLFSRIL